MNTKEVKNEQQKKTDKEILNRELKLLNKQLKQHKDVFVRLKDK